MSTLAPGKDGKDVAPPATLLPTGALDEVDAVRCRDGQAEGVPSHFLAVRHLEHLVHVYAGLGDGFRMFVHGVAQLAVVVQHKPAALPSLGAVEWVRKIPSWGYEEVPAFCHFPGSPIALKSFGTVLLLLSKAVGALAFVEDVGCEFSAFGPHQCC